MPQLITRLNRLLHRGNGHSPEALSEIASALRSGGERVLLIGHVAHIGPPATRRDFILWGHFDPEQKAYRYSQIILVATTRRIFWIGFAPTQADRHERYDILESVDWNQVRTLRLEAGTGGRIGVEILAGRDETTWLDAIYTGAGQAISIIEAEAILSGQRA